MHERDGCLVVMILQIVIEPAQLHDEKHPLIYDGAGRERADIGILRALLELAPDDIEHPVKCQPLFDMLRLGYEALHDAGHGISGEVAEDLRVYGYRPPAEQCEMLLLQDDLKHTHGKGALERILRKEEHADAVFSLLSEPDALHCGCLLEEPVADLRQYAYAVADLTRCVLARAVLELFDDAQRIVKNLIVPVTVDIDDGAYTARVMLEFQRLKELLPVLLLVYVVHSRVSFCENEKRRFEPRYTTDSKRHCIERNK